MPMPWLFQVVDRRCARKETGKAEEEPEKLGLLALHMRNLGLIAVADNNAT